MATHRRRLFPPQPPPRKHSKTFTGCWTCRARKVKCDELRPRCRQCCQKNLQCEGYDIRLQWMAPETGDGSAGDGPPPPPQGAQPKSYRSRVIQGSALPALPFQEIDDILHTIDSLPPETLIPSGQDTLESRSFKCFGVFDSAIHPQPQPPRGHDFTLSTNSSPRPQQASSSSSSSSSSSLAQPLDSNTTSIASGPDALQNVDLLDWRQPEIADDVLPSTSLPTWDDQLFTDLPVDYDDSYHNVLHLQPLDHHQLHDEPSAPQKWQDGLSCSIPRAPAPDSSLPSQEKFLLHHYATRVVHLFCALDNPKSPWKTIHLPRALQIAGEMVVSGSTSQIRHSLRNALLSISAFCLSNEHKMQAHAAEVQKWSRAGVCYRGVAVKHLKEAVGSGLSSESSRPKYKECLATMLSMISINVMSGDTKTCGVHLDGAAQLISQARSWKIKYSNKAQALHRVYFYLRTIYQSTLLRNEGGGVTGNGPGTCNHSAPPGASSSVSDVSEFLEAEDAHAPATASSTPLHASAHLSAYAHIYGVPQDLLVLLNRTVEVVNQVVQERERAQTRALPLHLAPRCSELEKDIMDWSADCKDGGDNSTNSDIVRHMTHAFHNAVIIYFAQHVHLLAHHYLQPFIRKVIESIEEIENIKTQTKILAAPLYWPAFIAASEAFDPKLQERIQNWYKRVEIYGIESVRTGIGVLLDVWEQGPCQGLTTTSIWRMVVQRTGATLILS